jgi:hypothetical protein
MVRVAPFSPRSSYTLASAACAARGREVRELPSISGRSWPRERRLQFRNPVAEADYTRGGGEMNILYIMGIVSVVLFIFGFLGLE